MSKLGEISIILVVCRVINFVNKMIICQSALPLMVNSSGEPNGYPISSIVVRIIVSFFFLKKIHLLKSMIAPDILKITFINELNHLKHSKYTQNGAYYEINE